MSNESTHTVLCDGGLSNRLNALIFSLILKEKYNQPWKISWPINNWCGASFKSLFSTRLVVNDYSLSYHRNNENNYTLILHENQAKFTEEMINYQSNLKCYQDYELLLKQNKPVLYYHNLIPGFANFEEIKLALENISIDDEIYLRARDFCFRNEIDDTTIGIHIRKTDFGNLVDESAIYEFVKKSSKRFFVCSDDEVTNMKFSQLENCSVFKKTQFPSKIENNFGFQHITIDNEGRVFSSNINRSEQSVIEALIDLLILSKTAIVDTSPSTFLLMSKIFKIVNFFKWKD